MIIGISGKIGSGKDTVGKIIQYLISPEYKEGWNNYNNWIDAIYEPTFKSTWQIKKFAFAVKQVCSILTGIPVEDFEKEEVKNRVLGEEWNYYKRITDIQWSDRTITDITTTPNNVIDIKYRYTVRDLLQKVGTDAIRDIIHPDAWVNVLMNQYKPNGVPYDRLGDLFDDLKHCPSETKYPNWIITDVRFPNEYDAVTKKGGILIRVNCRELYLQNANTTIDTRSSNHPSETALDNHKFHYTIDNNGTIEELIEKVKEILIKEKIL